MNPPQISFFVENCSTDLTLQESLSAIFHVGHTVLTHFVAGVSMKLNWLHHIWFLNSNHIDAGGTTGVQLLLSDTVKLRNPHARDAGQFWSFLGGTGFSGPAHSVEEEVGCTADS